MQHDSMQKFCMFSLKNVKWFDIRAIHVTVALLVVGCVGLLSAITQVAIAAARAAKAVKSSAVKSSAPYASKAAVKKEVKEEPGPSAPKRRGPPRVQIVKTEPGLKVKSEEVDLISDDEIEVKQEPIAGSDKQVFLKHQHQLYDFKVQNIWFPTILGNSALSLFNQEDVYAML